MDAIRANLRAWAPHVAARGWPSSGLVLRFGEQLDTQTVNAGPAGELSPEHAARCIAKYATKSAGLGYLTTGDTALALSAAARAREQRQAARDAV